MCLRSRRHIRIGSRSGEITPSIGTHQAQSEDRDERCYLGGCIVNLAAGHGVGREVRTVCSLAHETPGGSSIFAPSFEGHKMG